MIGEDTGFIAASVPVDDDRFLVSMTSPQVFDPGTCALAELTEYIRSTHHAYLRGALPAIWDLLREALGDGPAARSEIRSFAQLFGQFRSTLENHLRKEEGVLFPFIERLERTVHAGVSPPRHAFGPLALPIEILEAEHALGDRLLDRMRPIWQRWAPLDEAPRWQSSVYERLLLLEKDMQRHVHLEDEILFPRTIHLERRPCPLPAALR